MLRRARLRDAAHTAVQEPGALPVMQPCTLPCSLLDEQLGLSAINFCGPAPRLIYTARQRGVEGAADATCWSSSLIGGTGQRCVQCA